MAYTIDYSHPYIIGSVCNVTDTYIIYYICTVTYLVISLTLRTFLFEKRNQFNPYKTEIKTCHKKSEDIPVVCN